MTTLILGFLTVSIFEMLVYRLHAANFFRPPIFHHIQPVTHHHRHPTRPARK